MLNSVELSPRNIDRQKEQEQIIIGGRRAAHFIRSVVAGKKVDGKKYKFDSDLILAIHDRVYNLPGVASSLRENVGTTVRGMPVTSAGQELKHRFYAFGRWLEESVDNMRKDPENLILALQVASAAHLGLTMRDLHPFDDGNGRTARALVNAILMTQAYELTALHHSLLPVPIIRSASQVEDKKYINALVAAEQMGVLNPLMSYLAIKWAENLRERLRKIYIVIGTPRSTGDQLFIDEINARLARLDYFIKYGAPGDIRFKSKGKKNSFVSYPIPDYFELRNLRGWDA